MIWETRANPKQTEKSRKIRTKKTTPMAYY